MLCERHKVAFGVLSHLFWIFQLWLVSEVGKYIPATTIVHCTTVDDDEKPSSFNGEQMKEGEKKRIRFCVACSTTIKFYLK